MKALIYLRVDEKEMLHKFEFSLAEYDEMLRFFVDEKYSFCSFESLETSTKSVFLRHDVDSEMFLLADMAQIEAHLGIRSTYFLMTASTAYNLHSCEARKAIELLLENGHAIGLHYMNEDVSDEDIGGLIEDIAHHAFLLERLTGTPISSFSFHQPRKRWLSQSVDVPNLINVYDLESRWGIVYTSDTNRKWGTGHPVDLATRSVEKMQVLVHPMWWTSDATTANDCWQRVRNSIVNNLVEHWAIRERSFHSELAESLKISD